MLGTIAVKQEHGEQSAGTNLIGPGELAIMAVGDRHGHAGLIDAEPGSHRGERAVRAMIGAGQQSERIRCCLQQTGDVVGRRRDSSRLAPIITGPFPSVWKLIKTRHMSLEPSKSRNAIDNTT